MVALSIWQNLIGCNTIALADTDSIVEISLSFNFIREPMIKDYQFLNILR